MVNRKESKFPIELSNYIEEKGISIIELSPVFEKLKKKEINPYFWKGTKKTGHWNHATHEEIAKYLNKVLINKI